MERQGRKVREYYISAIRYDKTAGEYTIKERDAITGEASRTVCNHLTAREIAWTEQADRYEDRWSIQWAGGATA